MSENSLLNTMHASELDTNGTINTLGNCHTEDLKSVHSNCLKSEEKREYKRYKIIL